MSRNAEKPRASFYYYSKKFRCSVLIREKITFIRRQILTVLYKIKSKSYPHELILVWNLLRLILKYEHFNCDFICFRISRMLRLKTNDNEYWQIMWINRFQESELLLGWKKFGFFLSLSCIQLFRNLHCCKLFLLWRRNMINLTCIWSNAISYTDPMKKNKIWPTKCENGKTKSPIFKKF